MLELLETAKRISDSARRGETIAGSPRPIREMLSAKTHRTRRRMLLFLVVPAIVSYIGVYSSLSAQGDYLGHNQGGQDNRNTWAPAFCAELYTSPMGRQALRLTPLGWFFLPPLLVDRLLVHRTRVE